jgi:DNA-binding response OmpR family regulator
MSDPQATILVVEDDPATRVFLADNLAADGFDPLVAGDSTDALHQLEHALPDACVLDLCLPDGDGLAILDRIRGADGVASRVNPDVPVLVVSGKATVLDRQRGLSRGADDYLGKPFAYEEVKGAKNALFWLLFSSTDMGVEGTIDTCPAGPRTR